MPLKDTMKDEFYKGYHPPVMEGCECDTTFSEYLASIENQQVFHFGTGIHHLVGRKVHKTSHYVTGITVSRIEYSAYMDLLEQDPTLLANYKLLFGNIYRLGGLVPRSFDLITLFHLCEYSNDQFYRDYSLITTLSESLKESGRLVFWAASSSWKEAEAVIKQKVKYDKIVPVGEFKSLRFYSRRS